jgi:hypothetical protein
MSSTNLTRLIDRLSTPAPVLGYRYEGDTLCAPCAHAWATREDDSMIVRHPITNPRWSTCCCAACDRSLFQAAIDAATIRD